MTPVKFPRRKGLAVAAVASASLLLAACGSSSSSSSTASGSPAASGSGSASAASLLATACIDNSNLGGDLTIPVGAVLSLSGSGAFYGDTMSSGAKLAAAEIKAAGGPDFQLNLLDHKDGNAQAGVAATRQLGENGTRFALYSYVGALGSAFQGIEQYKMLSLDGGGGTQLFGQGKPYFYGTRAPQPFESFPGIAEWIKTKQPDVKTASIILPDNGAENVKGTLASATAALASIGVTVKDSEVVTYGGTDFQTAVTKIIAANADAVINTQYGSDVGYFLKQYRGAGGKAPVFGVDLVPDALKIAGPQASAGFAFGTQYFDPTNPGNDWGKHFVEAWKAAYPDKPAPDFYAGDYYRDMFTIWHVVQRVLAAGGDVNNPDDVLKAFTSDLSFPDIAGAPANGTQCGSYSMDPTTHAANTTYMAMLEVQPDGTSTKVAATFNVGAKDFKLAN